MQYCLGAELEFYLTGDVTQSQQDVLQVLQEKIAEYQCKIAPDAFCSVEKEKGQFQYEITFQHTFVPENLIERINSTKAFLGTLLKSNNLAVNFAGKPFASDYGSSLHIHISLHDADGRKLYIKEGDSYSAVMLHSIGGILYRLRDDLPIFAPTENCLLRYQQPGFDSPTHICWGNNNRTVALRIPESPSDSKRLEHRVASASADPAKTIYAIIDAVRYGIENKIQPSKQIFGNAWLSQYELERIVTCYLG